MDCVGWMEGFLFDHAGFTRCLYGWTSGLQTLDRPQNVWQERCEASSACYDTVKVSLLQLIRPQDNVLLFDF